MSKSILKSVEQKQSGANLEQSILLHTNKKSSKLSRIISFMTYAYMWEELIRRWEFHKSLRTFVLKILFFILSRSEYSSVYDCNAVSPVNMVIRGFCNYLTKKWILKYLDKHDVLLQVKSKQHRLDADESRELVRVVAKGTLSFHKGSINLIKKIAKDTYQTCRQMFSKDSSTEVQSEQPETETREATVLETTFSKINSAFCEFIEKKQKGDAMLFVNYASKNHAKISGKRRGRKHTALEYVLKKNRAFLIAAVANRKMIVYSDIENKEHCVDPFNWALQFGFPRLALKIWVDGKFDEDTLKRLATPENLNILLNPSKSLWDWNDYENKRFLCVKTIFPLVEKMITVMSPDVLVRYWLNVKYKKVDLVHSSLFSMFEAKAKEVMKMPDGVNCAELWLTANGASDEDGELLKVFLDEKPDQLRFFICEALKNPHMNMLGAICEHFNTCDLKGLEGSNIVNEKLCEIIRANKLCFKEIIANGCVDTLKSALAVLRNKDGTLPLEVAEAVIESMEGIFSPKCNGEQVKHILTIIKDAVIEPSGESSDEKPTPLISTLLLKYPSFLCNIAQKHNKELFAYALRLCKDNPNCNIEHLLHEKVNDKNILFCAVEDEETFKEVYLAIENGRNELVCEEILENNEKHSVYTMAILKNHLECMEFIHQDSNVLLNRSIIQQAVEIAIKKDDVICLTKIIQSYSKWIDEDLVEKMVELASGFRAEQVFSSIISSTGEVSKLIETKTNINSDKFKGIPYIVMKNNVMRKLISFKNEKYEEWTKGIDILLELGKDFLTPMNYAKLIMTTDMSNKSVLQIVSSSPNTNSTVFKLIKNLYNIFGEEFPEAYQSLVFSEEQNRNIEISNYILKFWANYGSKHLILRGKINTEMFEIFLASVDCALKAIPLNKIQSPMGYGTNGNYQGLPHIYAQILSNIIEIIDTDISTQMPMEIFDQLPTKLLITRFANSIRSIAYRANPNERLAAGSSRQGKYGISVFQYAIQKIKNPNIATIVVDALLDKYSSKKDGIAQLLKIITHIISDDKTILTCQTLNPVVSRAIFNNIERAFISAVKNGWKDEVMQLLKVCGPYKQIKIKPTRETLIEVLLQSVKKDDVDSFEKIITFYKSRISEDMVINLMKATGKYRSKRILELLVNKNSAISEVMSALDIPELFMRTDVLKYYWGVKSKSNIFRRLIGATNGTQDVSDDWDGESWLDGLKFILDTNEYQLNPTSYAKLLFSGTDHVSTLHTLCNLPPETIILVLSKLCKLHDYEFPERIERSITSSISEKHTASILDSFALDFMFNKLFNDAGVNALPDIIEFIEKSINGLPLGEIYLPSDYLQIPCKPSIVYKCASIINNIAKKIASDEVIDENVKENIRNLAQIMKKVVDKTNYQRTRCYDGNEKCPYKLALEGIENESVTDIICKEFLDQPQPGSLWKTVSNIMSVSLFWQNL